MNDFYYIEVSLKEACNCSNMIEVFLVEAIDKEAAIDKVKLKLSRAKQYVISRVYRCADIKDGVYLIYTKNS